MPLRTTEDFNYLSYSIQTLGLTLMGISLFVIIISAAWVFWRRKERTVTASQPQFLYLLCLGATLQAISLVFISFDESFGWSDDQLDRACSALPWFFVTGYLLQYCAIFSITGAFNAAFLSKEELFSSSSSSQPATFVDKLWFLGFESYLSGSILLH